MTNALQIDLGKTGAKRQSWRAANPRAVLRQAIEDNPDATKDELEEECWRLIKNEADLVRTVFGAWFSNNYESLIRSKSNNSSDLIKTKAAEIHAQVRERIVSGALKLLDLAMPDGKALRNSTREDLIVFGGWLTRVAEKLRPNQTVEDAGIPEADLLAAFLG